MSIYPQTMLKGLPSRVMDLVNPVMACLVMVQGAENGRGILAEIEPLLMMRPPWGVCAFLRRIASWEQKKAPHKWVLTTPMNGS